MTSYVVSEGLISGAIFLVVIALVTGMIGWAGAALTIRLRRA